MVVGEILPSGKLVLSLVEAQTKGELVYVTTLLPNTAVMIVLSMDHQLRKPNDATKIRVQVRLSRI